MECNTKRPRGGQPGNHNARKHGFYSRAFKSSDRSNIEDAARISGLDQEISLLRAQLKIVLERDPENARLIALIASTLARLMRTNAKLPKSKEQTFAIAGLGMIAEFNGMTLEEFAEKLWAKIQSDLHFSSPGEPHQTEKAMLSPFDYFKK